MLADHYAFSGRSRKPSIVLEAICDQNCKVMFYNFGSPGVQNDLAILRSSPLIKKYSSGEWPNVAYKVGSVQREVPYVLCDGIYPSWDTFVLGFESPLNEASYKT